jgi:hypothetical protein
MRGMAKGFEAVAVKHRLETHQMHQVGEASGVVVHLRMKLSDIKCKYGLSVEYMSTAVIIGFGKSSCVASWPTGSGGWPVDYKIPQHISIILLKSADTAETMKSSFTRAKIEPF